MTAQDDRPSGGDAPLAELMSEAALAERWDVTVRTMQRRRAAGGAPPYVKIGSKVFYVVAGVRDHEEAATVRPGGAP